MITMNEGDRNIQTAQKERESVCICFMEMEKKKNANTDRSHEKKREEKNWQQPEQQRYEFFSLYGLLLRERRCIKSNLFDRIRNQCAV